MPPVSPCRHFESVDPQDPIRTHQMMLDVAEQELGIQPVLSSTEMATMAEPDRLGLITYLSQFYEAFKTLPGANFGVIYSILIPPLGLAGCPPLCKVGPMAMSPPCRGRGGHQEVAVSTWYTRSHPLPQQAAEEPEPDTQACPGEGSPSRASWMPKKRDGFGSPKTMPPSPS